MKAPTAEGRTTLNVLRLMNSAGSRSDHEEHQDAAADSRDSSSGAASLIDRARHGSRSSLGQLLQQYRNYLVVLATTQIDKRLQPRVSPSDVVQEAMLRAHKNFAQFRGTTEQE